MEFNILKEQLEENLSLAVRFTSTKISSVQSLQGAHIKTGKGEIHITTTNLNDFFRTTVKAGIVKEGEGVIDVRRVIEFLGFLEPGQVGVVADPGGVVVTQGKTEGQFGVYQKDEFPPPQSVEGEQHELSQEGVKLLPLVLFSASKDETRPELTSIYMTTEEKGQGFVSTDGFRLSLLETGGKGGTPNIMVSSWVLQEAAKLSKEKPLQFTLSEKDKLIKFAIGGSEIVTRVIEGNFPPYKKVIPTSHSTRALLDKKQLTNNVRLVSVFAREQADVVVWDISAEGLYLRPKLSKKRKATIFQEVEKFEGKEAKIAFNYKYVLEFLNTIPDDKVVIELSGETSPGVFKSPSTPGFLHIIMPLRLDETDE